MTYESLLLHCGGGFISDAQRSDQNSGSAALCIGIGGTGIAALSDLKGKVYQQLMPDNPGDPFPRYDGIQFLGIDSDVTDYKRYHGNCRLDEDEFFSIKKDHLVALLTDAPGKSLIRNDPCLNWMEIDRINTMLSPVGAGCVRQMGRYMLIERAAALFHAIERKAITALCKRGCRELDIYIFAGISGGTGSGCFLDTCYLVRQAVQNNGWNAKLMGFFFLPDVVTSKPELDGSCSIVSYNNINGYAALKELDYLMDLPAVNDWFEQNYGSFQIRTQDPPVDMCHLISARQANGKLVPNGFGYGINLVSDYVMLYLAGSNNGGAAPGLRGHLDNVVRGVQTIPHRFGANLSYHILGASCAEIPLNQINTYLAVAFFKKFQDAAYKEKKVITKDIVQRFMEENRFTVRDVYNDVIRNSPTLDLVDIDRKVLAGNPCCAKNELPRTWADIGNGWLMECEGIRTRNALPLNRKLESYSLQDVNDQSLIGRLFRKLWELSVDPAYGPYYAAALLDNNGQDLQAALAGVIAEANEKAGVQAFHIPHREEYKIECNQELIKKRGNRRSYGYFKSSCEDLLVTINTRNECSATAKVLSEFLIQVKALSEGFFRPLITILENLRETFEANDAYLQTPQAKAPDAYTWQILNLNDVKDRLDEAVAALDPQDMVRAFSAYLLENSGSWMDNKSEQVAKLIRDYILKLFSEQTNRSPEDYLYEMFLAKNPFELAICINRRLLPRLDESSDPVFFCDPTYDINSPHNTFTHNCLISPAISSAAVDFEGYIHGSYTVCETGLRDRIFAAMLIHGVPLHAYAGLEMMKHDYDVRCTTSAGVGSHLYAYTGRGRDASGFKDWRSFLPTPIPYSKVKNMDRNNMIPEGPALERLYEAAVARGIIGTVSDPDQDDYYVFTTPDTPVKAYTLDDFLKNNEFDYLLYDKVLRQLTETKDVLHDPKRNPDCRTIPLKNDGDPMAVDPRDVRIDHFVRAPMLQKAVREELEKQDALNNAIAQVSAFHKEFKARTRNLTKPQFMPSPPPIAFPWVYDGERVMEYHPVLNHDPLYHRETNTWVPIESGMQILVNHQWFRLEACDAPPIILPSTVPAPTVSDPPLSVPSVEAPKPEEA